MRYFRAFLSYHLNTAPGGTIALTSITILIICLIITKTRTNISSCFLHSSHIPAISILCFVKVNPVLFSMYCLKILNGHVICTILLQKLTLYLVYMRSYRKPISTHSIITNNLIQYPFFRKCFTCSIYSR